MKLPLDKNQMLLHSDDLKLSYTKLQQCFATLCRFITHKICHSVTLYTPGNSQLDFPIRDLTQNFVGFWNVG
jgi:hypothetical protein